MDGLCPQHNNVYYASLLPFTRRAESSWCVVPTVSHPGRLQNKTCFTSTEELLHIPAGRSPGPSVNRLPDTKQSEAFSNQFALESVCGGGGGVLQNCTFLCSVSPCLLHKSLKRVFPKCSFFKKNNHTNKALGQFVWQGIACRSINKGFADHSLPLRKAGQTEVL